MTLVGAGLTATATIDAEPARAADACTVAFDTTQSEAGFTHPGVSLTAEHLENARAQVQAGVDPWKTYYTAMSTSPAAATTVTSSNASSADPTRPATTALDSQSINSRFIADGLKSYTQALMYVFTGEQVYRTNAMNIIRIWSQMDPTKYVYFTDSHIHTGIPLNRMVTAAELLRYGSCATDSVPWTDADTTAFSNNLIKPVIATFQSDQNHFMNQHNYPLLGAMAGSIFLDDAEGYAKSVEWFTVNSTANDQGFNGSVERLFRLVDRDDSTGEPIAEPRVQHVEMGRDQAHGGGDVTNAYMLSRLMLAQGTKVDPEAGTISAAADAVGPYEFLNDRILAAADYFWKYTLGYDIDWTPVGYAISPDGTVRDTYDRPSEQYRGRYNTAGFWDLYYYYTYERGEDFAEIAPHLAEAFAKRLPPDYYYRGSLTRAWDNVDAGGEFWLYAPAEAAGTSAPRPQTDPTTLQLEDRYTNLSGQVQTVSENDISFVRLTAGAQPAKIAYLNGSTTNKRFALTVRTNELTRIKLSFGLDKTIIIPDTQGEWRQIVVDLTGAEALADLLYIETIGGTGSVDLDALVIDTKTLVPTRLTTAPERVLTTTGSTVETQFAAEAAAGANVKYSAEGLPAEASIDSSTGVLRWTPTANQRHDVTVSASDGVSVTAKTVSLIAGTDRAEVVRLAQEGHEDEIVYSRATQSVFDAAVAAALSASGEEDAVFEERIATLAAATDALAPVSPKTPFGSLDYPSLLASSSAGSNTSLLIDGNPQTGTVYQQAIDLSTVYNFGPFAKVKAEKFGLRSNIFEDRLANAAVFASNDGTTWTRLTPQVTTMTQDMQYLEVSPELLDDTFQYVKVQILKALPDVLYGQVRNMHELTEFHIFGERSETVGEITAVSISAPGSVKNRVVPGSTVTLDFAASATITDVGATIAGVPAQVATSDGGRTWKATATLPASAQSGAALPFSVEHTTSTGVRAQPIVTTSDGSQLYVSSDAGLVDSVFKAATVSAAEGTANFPTPQAEAAKLFDQNAATYTDTRISNGRAALVWDLGEGASVSIRDVDVLVRQDQFGTSRLSGLRFEGSTDGTTWTPLTSDVRASSSWQRLTSIEDDAFRYIRLTNANTINLAETRIFGTYIAPLTIVDAVKISSSNSVAGYAVAGDTVTLDITTKEAPGLISATIDGVAATIQNAGSPTSFRATAVLPASERVGSKVAFTIDHTTADGRRAVTTRSTTDGSSMQIGTNDRFLGDLLKVSTAVTLAGTPDTSTVARPKNLFDGLLTTFTDARVLNGSADIVFDLGSARQVGVERIEVAVRQDTFGLTRNKNTRIQGSNDRQTWETLASGVQATYAWQSLPVQTSLVGKGYRYLRITNSEILNLSEMRVFGTVFSPITSIAPIEGVTTYRGEAPQLPATVVASRADGSTSTEKVTWDTVDPAVWGTEGEVSVNGTVAGSTVRAVIAVKVVAKPTPTEPTSVAAAAVGADVKVTWDAPTSDGGWAITGYRVYDNTGAKVAEVGADARETLITGLAPATTWVFSVAAVSSAGEGSRAAASSVTTGSITLASSVRAKCLAGKVYLYTSVTNRDEAAATIVVRTPYGNKTYTDVAPGKTVSAAIPSRLTSTPSGQMIVDASQPDGVTAKNQVAYPALSCR